MPAAAVVVMKSRRFIRFGIIRVVYARFLLSFDRILLRPLPSMGL